jgi:UDP-glucose 4-epimerase
VTKREDFAACDDHDVVFFLAGISGPARSLADYEAYVRINEIGLLNLLDHLKQLPRKPRVVFPSTRLVYKGNKDQPLTEEAPKEFLSIYASNKHACEQYLAMHRRMFGIDYSIYRICVPYGDLVGGAESYGTVGFFLGRARSGQPIRLFGDGALKRTFTHVGDVCRQIAETATRSDSSGECYNVDGETFSLREVAELIAARYGVAIEYAEWPESDLRLESGDTIFDASKIRGLLQPTLEHTLAGWVEGLRT